MAMIVLGLGRSAQASTIFYSDRASFLSAVAPATNIDFEGIAPANSYADIYGNTISGVTFTTDSGNLVAIDPAFFPSYYDWGSGATAIGYYYADPIRAALPAGKNAVGADVMIVDAYNGGVAEQMFATITLLDATTVTQSITTLPIPGRAFMGFTADQPILSIAFYTPDISGGSGPNYYPFSAIDNFVVSTSPVTEPSSLLLVATGAALLRRRMKHSATSTDSRRA
jgi:hypothetical protein